jgi:hypothetical protein
MRVWLGATVVFVTVSSAVGLAQETVAPALPHRTAPAVTATDPLGRLVERFRPFHDRLIQDDRVRAAGSLVGLGVMAYEASRAHPQLPLTAVGTEALRLGLHRQLTFIRQRSGYAVEPSIGYRSFVVTFRRVFN